MVLGTSCGSDSAISVEFPQYRIYVTSLGIYGVITVTDIEAELKPINLYSPDLGFTHLSGREQVYFDTFLSTHPHDPASTVLGSEVERLALCSTNLPDWLKKELLADQSVLVRAAMLELG